MRVYVASRASIPERPRLWRELRARGVKVVSTWIDQEDIGDGVHFWSRVVEEVLICDRLVLYVPGLADLPLKGAFVEAGIALGAGIEVVVVAPPEVLGLLGSWTAHPAVSISESLEQAVGLA